MHKSSSLLLFDVDFLDIEVNRDGERVADLKRKVIEALDAYDKNVRLQYNQRYHNRH